MTETFRERWSKGGSAWLMHAPPWEVRRWFRYVHHESIRAKELAAARAADARDAASKK